MLPTKTTTVTATTSITVTVPITTTVLCASCGGRLARDHTDTICSPCRRSMIERAARRATLIAHDTAGIKAAFDSSGLYGVAAHLNTTPVEALDVMISTRLLPFIPQRRKELLRQLIALAGTSHIAAAKALNVSRWTVATYRRQLGIDRAPVSLTGRPR